MKKVIGALAIMGLSKGALAVALISNGGFESGFSNWTVSDLPGGSGSWFVSSGTTAPVSGLSTVGPQTGSSYALTDQTGPGTHSLTQTFNVAAGSSNVILSFGMFVNSYGGFIPNGGVLDHTGNGVEFGRVDLLTGSANAFDTGAGVISNLFLGIDNDANPNPYTDYSIDITGLVAAGGAFQIRFAESDNQGFFNMGVDNVSIEAQTNGVPEPGSLALIGIALAGLFAVRKRQV